MINIFNEEKYATEILNKGFIGNKQGLELFILAKYYRFKENKTKKECKELLIQFCNTQMEDYQNSDLYKKVNSTIDRAYSKDVVFLNINYIEFNECELSYINSLNISPAGKQTLFGLWCCNKLNIKAGQSDKWVNISYTELKKFSNLSSGNMLKIMNELYNNGLIFVSDRCAICLTFLEDYNVYFDEYIKEIYHNHKNKDVMPPIDSYCVEDFKTCGLWWQKFNGSKKVIVCDDCGVLTVRNSNRQKYCKDCSRQRELEKQIRYNAKRDNV